MNFLQIRASFTDKIAHTMNTTKLLSKLIGKHQKFAITIGQEENFLISQNNPLEHKLH